MGIFFFFLAQACLPGISFQVVYDLVVTLESALKMFSIEIDGVEMGVVKVNFRS